MADGESRFDGTAGDASDGLAPDPNLEQFRKLCMSAFAEACVVRRKVDRGWPMLRRRLKGQRVTDEWVGRRIMLNHAYDMLVAPNRDALAHALELATKCVDYSFFRRDLPPAQVNLAVLRLEQRGQERRKRVADVVAHPVGTVADVIRQGGRKARDTKDGEDAQGEDA